MSTTSPTPPSPQGTISGSTFKWNRAADDGSALAIADAYPTLNQVGVVENIAGGNAAIALFGASLQMLNTTVARNTAGSGTGGLNVGGASGDEVLIVHSSLVENDPLGLRTTGAPDVELRSSIVAENQAGNCSAITTPITSGNYNDNFEAADLSQWSGSSG